MTGFTTVRHWSTSPVDRFAHRVHATSENNTDSAADEVDLHGLYVAEAISRTEAAIQKAQSQGKDHLDIIVGKVRLVHLES